MNPSAPENLQIYKYGGDVTDTNPEIKTTGNGTINGLIFTPQEEVELTSNGYITAAVWSNKFRSTGNGGINQGITDPSKLQVSFPQSNTIDPIRSWQRQEVQ